MIVQSTIDLETNTYSDSLYRLLSMLQQYITREHLRAFWSATGALDISAEFLLMHAVLELVDAAIIKKSPGHIEIWDACGFSRVGEWLHLLFLQKPIAGHTSTGTGRLYYSVHHMAKQNKIADDAGLQTLDALTVSSRSLECHVVLQIAMHI